MKIIKILLNPRVVTAVISAIGAIISASFAGCRLAMAEMSIRDFEAEVFSVYNSTNIIQEVK